MKSADSYISVDGLLIGNCPNPPRKRRTRCPEGQSSVKQADEKSPPHVAKLRERGGFQESPRPLRQMRPERKVQGKRQASPANARNAITGKARARVLPGKFPNSLSSIGSRRRSGLQGKGVRFPPLNFNAGSGTDVRGRHGKPGTSRARSKRASADGIRTGEGFFAVGIPGKGERPGRGADSLTKDESSRQGRRRRGRRVETRQEKRTEKTDHVKMTVIPGMRPSAADGRAEAPNRGDSSLASGETEAYIRFPDRPEGRTGRVAGGTTAERSVHGCA